MFWTYLYIGICTALCTLSVYINYRVFQKNGQWRYWYTALYEWAIDLGLVPPTPKPEDVEKTPIPSYESRR